MLIGFVFVPVAAARDGYFFAFFAPKEDEQGMGLPVVSLAVIIFLTGVCCFLSLDLVIDAMTTMLCLIMFCGQSAGLMYYRYTTPKEQIPDGWKMPFFPLPCIIQFIIFFFIFITSNSAIRGKKPVLEMSVGFLVFGAICFLIRSRIQRTWPFEDESSTTESIKGSDAPFAKSPGGQLVASPANSANKLGVMKSPIAISLASPVRLLTGRSDHVGVRNLLSPLSATLQQVTSSPHGSHKSSMMKSPYMRPGTVLQDFELENAPLSAKTVVRDENTEPNEEKPVAPWDIKLSLKETENDVLKSPASNAAADCAKCNLSQAWGR